MIRVWVNAGGLDTTAPPAKVKVSGSNSVYKKSGLIFSTADSAVIPISSEPLLFIEKQTQVERHVGNGGIPLHYDITFDVLRNLCDFRI